MDGKINKLFFKYAIRIPGLFRYNVFVRLVGTVLYLLPRQMKIGIHETKM
jgi:hypothetical protein